MARPDTSIDPRIMDSAREEFLALGFERASLKSICQRAGVTTGALYKRYAGKEELFRAVVADTVADLDCFALWWRIRWRIWMLFMRSGRRCRHPPSPTKT